MTDSHDPQSAHRVVGARLRDAREAMGLTQADVAQVIGWSRPTLVAVEKGDRKITGLELRRLARLYQRDVAWLLGEESTESAAASTALHRATANLSETDKQQVLRFAEFLAAQQRPAGGRTPRTRPRPPSGPT
jgi:transcriptional regulator with XRE-family HTH domain